MQDLISWSTELEHKVENSKGISCAAKGSKVCLDKHVVGLPLILLNVKSLVLHELD